MTTAGFLAAWTLPRKLVRLCFAVGCLALQAPAAADGASEVRVDARLQPQTATVGDLLRLEIEVTAPKGYQVVPPALAGKTGDLVVVESHPASDVPVPDPGRSRRLFRYSVAAYRTGELDLPAIEVAVRPVSGAEIRTPTPQLKVTIRSVLTGNDPQLRDLKKQAELEGRRSWLPWILAAAALALAGAAAWWWTRRSPMPPATPAALQPPEDPFVVAERQLGALHRQDLPGKGRVKEHYVEFSAIVRRILEAGFGIAALERTSEEILDELRGKDAFPGDPAGLQRVHALLDLCDMVKFAKYVSTATENDSALQVARRVLEDCRRPGRAAPVPAMK